MKKKSVKKEFRTVKCAGCGRYEKEVDSRVVNWYCSNCFMGNGNFFRKQAGKKLVKPVEKVKKGTKVKSVFGKEYKIQGVGYKYNKSVYYVAVPEEKSSTPFEFLGDFQIILK